VFKARPPIQETKYERSSQLMLITIFLLINLIGIAQDPVNRTINNLNGLPSNTVYNILQDKKGYIWIAHDKGLTRYDGKIFKSYFAPTQQGRSLSYIKEIDTTIWCQDFAGNVYYTKNDSLKKEEQLSSAGSYSPAAVINNSEITVISQKGISGINTANNVPFFVAQKNISISAVYSNGQSIVFTDANKIFQWSHKTTSLLFELPKPIPTFYFLQQAKQHYFGITKDHYPYVYQLDKDKCNALNILQPGLFVQDVTTIGNEIWVSTSTGAYCFNTNWQPLYNGFCFFSGSSISKIIKDREGNYWFSTLNKGIIIVPEMNTRLYKYHDNAITSLATDGNNIIAGTATNQLVYFNASSNSFTKNYSANANNEIVNIFCDNNKQRIIFSASKIFSLQPNGSVTIFGKSAGKCITILDSNFYLSAYSGGASLLRRNTSQVDVPTWLKNGKWQDNHYPLFNIATRGRWVTYSSKDSTVYVATSSGLYYFSPKGRGKITIGGKEIYASQLELVNDGLFAATFSDGLIFIDRKGVATNINNNGINKTIYKLKSDSNYLWLIIDGALQKYNRGNNTVVNYTYADGLPKAEIKDILIHNATIYLATTEGLVAFNDKLSNRNTIAPNLYINEVLVNNEAMPLNSHYQFASIQNNIAINFSLLSFRNSENAEKIEYKINEGNWQALASSSRTLSLASLAAGNYQIAIRAFNEDDIATNQNIQLHFSIAAPFYKQLWFLILIVLTAMALVFTIFMFRLKSIQQKNTFLSQKIKLEQELQQSMLTSIKSQMNPHFLFNALNTIQSYIYTNDKENASQYLGKFSTLTRMILDMSNKEIVCIADEIKALKLYLELEQLRFEDKLHYTLQIDNAISIETAYIPSMLIQPYVENAIKHGLLHKKNDWQLQIQFIKKNDGIVVIVDDNGIGRKRSEELNKHKARLHQSFATNANQKRLEILNKGLAHNIALEIIDKTDAHGNAFGTTVKLFIPFLKK
jgi:sensor histidine kinase YesM